MRCFFALLSGALRSCPLLLLLVACGNPQPSETFPTAANDHYVGKSWVAADIKQIPRLLFVSDNNYDVYILRLPDLKWKGELTGFSEPQGMCADLSGNVWVANEADAKMTLLSHDGSHLRDLSDPDGDPSTCAIDPTTGDLAVVNTGIYGGSGSPGEILIFTAASGTPTAKTIPNFFYYNFGGYDNDGNLFAIGRTSAHTTVLGVIPKGSSTGNDITITNGRINDPGFVQWYAPRNVLAVDDQECTHESTSCLYQLSISGSTGKIVRSTTFNYGRYKYPKCGFAQGEIAAYAQRYFIAPCNGIDRWPYPGGGAPINQNRDPQINAYAVAISGK